MAEGHPLLTPKTGAAFTVGGVVAGIGIAFMTAGVLSVGTFLCMVGAGVTVWLYWDEISVARQLLSDGSSSSSSVFMLLPRDFRLLGIPWILLQLGAPAYFWLTYAAPSPPPHFPTAKEIVQEQLAEEHDLYRPYLNGPAQFNFDPQLPPVNLQSLQPSQLVIVEPFYIPRPQQPTEVSATSPSDSALIASLLNDPNNRGAAYRDTGFGTSAFGVGQYGIGTGAIGTTPSALLICPIGQEMDFSGKCQEPCPDSQTRGIAGECEKPAWSQTGHTGLFGQPECPSGQFRSITGACEPSALTATFCPSASTTLVFANPDGTCPAPPEQK
jgi:hypothetical protein